MAKKKDHTPVPKAPEDSRSVRESGSIRFNTDLRALRKLTEGCRRDPGMLRDLEQDPRGFLAQFGVEIDEATAEAIQGNLASRKSIPDTLASITSVHIDV